mmetsp:Transcript_16310/g.14235  ORF Transcript_16310/g.14235 Transcript_16310/m.14235 type:complete len:181 (+) Transcript_16310:675-1217(+)
MNKKKHRKALSISSSRRKTVLRNNSSLKIETFENKKFDFQSTLRQELNMFSNTPKTIVRRNNKSLIEDSKYIPRGFKYIDMSQRSVRKNLTRRSHERNNISIKSILSDRNNKNASLNHSLEPKSHRLSKLSQYKIPYQRLKMPQLKQDKIKNIEIKTVRGFTENVKFTGYEQRRSSCNTP